MTDFRNQVRRALIWRSGMQIAAQTIQWVLTLVVIRLLVPRDYGLVAMTEVVTAFLGILSGYGFSSAIIQAPEVSKRMIRQFFGLLLLLNGSLAAVQLCLAPLAAAYYREPVIADMLRLQAVNYLLLPFITLPLALASRKMDFRSPAIIHFIAMIASGVAVVSLALWGAGVWSLVIGTVVVHAARAIGMAVATRWLVWPVFRFDGVGRLFTFGAAVMADSVIWFLYSQADVFIGGRHLPAAELGLYSTALFLATLPVAKFLPALNEVGLAAYARIQHDLAAVQANFVRSVRMVALLFYPVFLGLAVIAERFVPVVMGAQWVATVPIIQTIALAMPLYSLFAMMTPVVNALGHPRVGLINSFIGLFIMPVGFLIGVQWGAIGLARVWLLGFPLLFLISMWRSLAAMKMEALPVLRAVMPGLASSLLMAGAVLAVRQVIDLAPVAELVLLIGVGAAVYLAAAALLFPAALRDLASFAGLKLPGNAG